MGFTIRVYSLVPNHDLLNVPELRISPDGVEGRSAAGTTGSRLSFQWQTLVTHDWSKARPSADVVWDITDLCEANRQL